MKIPDYFGKYGSESSEKGLVEIELTRTEGKTSIRRMRTRAPLLIQKALYPDARFPGMAHLYLMSSAGGILQGDRFEIDVVAGVNTVSRITTQAATKIYKMEKNFAAQSVKISSGKASYLEFIPYQLIPFKSSRFYQQVDIHLEENSTIVYSETVSAGRTASGENFDFDICQLDLTVRNKERILFADNARLESRKKDLERLFDGKDLWSMIYIITPNVESIEKKVNAEIKQSSFLAGYSVLPNECGLVVRILDNSIDKIRQITEEMARIARDHALLRISN